jgi:hypothetical protein
MREPKITLEQKVSFSRLDGFYRSCKANCSKLQPP